jgi:high-affinity nickel permease
MSFVEAIGAGSAFAVAGGAFALGLRHGIDWDHIAAITDITSSTAPQPGRREAALMSEPGLQLTDESHHTLNFALAGAGAGTMTAEGHYRGSAHQQRPALAPLKVRRWVSTQRQPLFLGTMYAIGHGTMVGILGLLAILFSQVLPSWVDPIMERVVGFTLVFLAAYLFYSLFRFFRSGEEFRLRSRWMLVFSGVQTAYHRLLHRAGAGHSHEHAAVSQQYGARTAYGIGLIHGIGAETGTQVLVIGTAVGAASKGMGVLTLFAFILGLLISNSAVTLMTSTGFVSARRRQVVYVVVGALAAVFSLTLGLLFLTSASWSLPELDRYFRWIGGPG